MNEDFEKTTQIIDELVGEIQYLNDMYRVGDPQVSDLEYDQMLVRLNELDPTHPLLHKGVIESEPTTRKRKLPIKMMSLNKEKSVDDIIKWLKKVGNSETEIVVITPKYNGISLLVNHSTGETNTRGDGEYGRDCDKHIQIINSDVKMNFNHLCSGEAIISRYNWDTYFRGKLSPSGQPYKLNNATVAGLLNCDEPTEELKYVDFVKYGIHNSDMYKIGQLQLINESSDMRTDFLAVPISSLTESILDQFYYEINKIYPIDGLVIELNDVKKRKQLDTESNGNPAYARALKLDKWVEEFDTTITGYIINISKQGKIKGVVTFNPVMINGTEVKQATFYNMQFLSNFNLCPGVHITVKKSGEIIPKITAVEGIHIPILSEFKKQSEYDQAYEVATGLVDKIIAERYEKEELDFDWNYFNDCPICNNPLSWDENRVELICTSNDCSGRLISKIEHFFLSIGVEEFGRPTIESLYKDGYNTVERILNITKSELILLEGFGDTSADIILEQFNRVKQEGVSQAQLMYAWDVFDGKIGEKTAQLILDNIQKKFSIEEMVKIKGVSEITAKCFLKGLETFITLPSVLKVKYISSPKKIVSNESYIGFSVCFSGVRDKELEKKIEDGGGVIASGVSKTTSHLVVSDVNQSTSKMVKARELNIPILTIEQFKQL